MCVDHCGGSDTLLFKPCYLSLNHTFSCTVLYSKEDWEQEPFLSVEEGAIITSSHKKREGETF